ncbi:hypothetical protein ACFZA9_21885 [Streptomyces olivaceus]|uniref:hypothetical protein n=1 Tax=Streptomyces olivaceus TaxID=47716 RepID=UPI0036E8944D
MTHKLVRNDEKRRVGRETMTGPRESDRSLMLSEIDQLKERIRAGEKLDAKQVAKELDANSTGVKRIINTLLWIETMEGNKND